MPGVITLLVARMRYPPSRPSGKIRGKHHRLEYVGNSCAEEHLVFLQEQSSEKELFLESVGKRYEQQCGTQGQEAAQRERAIFWK